MSPACVGSQPIRCRVTALVAGESTPKKCAIQPKCSPTSGRCNRYRASRLSAVGPAAYNRLDSPVVL